MPSQPNTADAYTVDPVSVPVLSAARVRLANKQKLSYR